MPLVGSMTPPLAICTSNICLPLCLSTILFSKDAAGKTYTVTVLIRGESQSVSCRADQTLLDALEKAGIRAPSHCRSGECGWCHSRLVSGDVYIPEDTDGRRLADKKFGWIHPCCSYPTSDVTLDVPVIG